MKGKTSAAKRAFPFAAPTPEQVDAALLQEFNVKPVEEGFRYWKVPVSMRFQIPGPLTVQAEMDDSPTDYDSGDLGVTVNLGGLTIRVGWDGAEAIAFAILEQLHGQDWTRLLMALTARNPTDFEQAAEQYGEPEVPVEAAQALWAAAYSYRKHWPDRTRGFDDRIWGCAAPEGVVAEIPPEPPQVAARTQEA